MRENYLAEAFKDMDALNEDVFSLDNLGTDALKDFLDGDKGVDFIAVIDTEAEDEEDIKDSYLGKVILDCCTCHSKCYKNKADIVLDDDEEYANVGEECAYCHSKDGFKIVGEVTEYDEEKDHDDEDEEEEEVEIKKDSEEEFDDNVDSFDFEDEEKVEESLNEEVSKIDDIDAEADDKKELAKKRFMRAKDNADSDRDYRLKKGITRKNESMPKSSTDRDALSKAKEFIKSATTKDGFYQKIRDILGDAFIEDWDIKRLQRMADAKYAELESKTPAIKESRIYKKIKESRKPYKEDLSYGEYATIEDEWEKFKEKTGRSDADAAWEFIETECKGTYDTDEEKQDVFSYISTLEEPIEEGKKITEAPSYELHPQYDSRQSFYGKARVDTGDKDDKNKLYSYNTLVAEMIDGKPVVYGTYSATTLRHIKDWLKQNGFKAENKAQIEADYMKEAKECKGKKCNIREGERRKGECKLTEAKEYTAETLAKDIKDAVDWLVGEQEGCVTLKLDDKLAVCVGWSGGYGNEKRDDVIQSTEDPDYAINAGIKVWTSDDMRTDYDWINYPYYKNGDIEDTGLSLEADEDYTKAAEWLLGEYDRMKNYEISDDGEIVEETEETIEESKKVNESVEEVKVTTETDEVNVKTEDGKVTVETQKREDETKKDEEVIEPISDEVKSEIEASSEKEIDGEFGDEVEVDMDDFDEESFDELGESYFKSAYSNIDSYKTSCVKAEGKRMVIEGVIKFKSGKEKSTSFVLESKEITKSGKSRFIGENMQICKGKKAFALNGTINGGRFISESFNYDYRTKDIKTGKSKRISGTVKKK